MKIKLLFAFLAFSLLSCSSDESTPVNTNPETENPETENPEPIFVDKDLYKVTEYNVNGNPYMITEFHTPGVGVGLLSNNPRICKWYDNSGDLITSQDYSYENGLLTHIFERNFDGSSDQNYDLQYDDQQRLIKVRNNTVGSTGGGITRNYIYNDDDMTVTVQFNPGTNIAYTFYYNEQGQVYKILGDYTTSEAYYTDEVIYEGNNVVQETSFNTYDGINPSYTSTRQFTHNADEEVLGDYFKINYNKFGGFKGNIVLYDRSFLELFKVSDNFITGEYQDSNIVVTYTYEFDDDGYPIKQIHTGPDGVSQRITAIEYYQ